MGRKVPLGAVYLENSLNHIFNAFQRKPLCGEREATSKLHKGDFPLFTIDNFASMEFGNSGEQSLVSGFTSSPLKET
ncbi:MAG: hypothetical protein L6Q37_14310 [Bdellovibrionaceae bacterium]|nr:hypothetical protein [Pseudobdellovibrionaceae bacterium]NUM58464.1 hypothetical protein [Pseudobdellovibrionaceae bacterium]